MLKIQLQYNFSVSAGHNDGHMMMADAMLDEVYTHVKIHWNKPWQKVYMGLSYWLCMCQITIWNLRYQVFVQNIPYSGTDYGIL